MKVSPILKVNNFNSENPVKSTEQRNAAFAQGQTRVSLSPAFNGNVFDWFKDKINLILDELEPSHPTRRTSRQTPHPPYKKGNAAVRKQVQQPARPKKTEIVKPENTVTLKKYNRYELLEDYEKITKERTEFRNRTRGRDLTPEEITERDALRNTWNAIKSKLRMEHQSIILKKSAAEFTTEGEKKDYIMKYVLPRMSETEESAFDALDMFEEFGFRAEYPSKLNTTISKLSEGVIGLPNQAKTDKMLARYLQVFDKYATNTPERHPDDEALGWVISDFCDNGCDISENSIIRGINIMKRVACQRWDYENLDNTLVSAYGAKFKDNQNVKNALLELKDAVKNLKYRLEAGDR